MIDTPLGFPAQRSQALFNQLLTSLRDQAISARTEAVTGRPSDIPAALGGRISDAIDLETAIAEISQRREIIALAETRTTAAQGSLSAIGESINDIATSALTALQNQATNGLEVLSIDARAALTAAISALNVTVAGRGVFAGDLARTPLNLDSIYSDSAALIDASPNSTTAEDNLRGAFNDPGGLFETVFYTGGTSPAPAAEIAEGERIEIGARADEQPIRDTLRALAQLGAAYDPDLTLSDADRRALAQSATDALLGVIDPLNRISARIGSAEARIEQVSARLNNEEAALTTTFNERIPVDPLIAAAEFQEISGQLEILYLTTSRFSQLSFVNFVR
ncbi:MAG: hypothetical protein ACFBSD_08665 [Paracoccaceae bacterium]